MPRLISNQVQPSKVVVKNLLLKQPYLYTLSRTEAALASAPEPEDTTEYFPTPVEDDTEPAIIDTIPDTWTYTPLPPETTPINSQPTTPVTYHPSDDIYFLTGTGTIPTSIIGWNDLFLQITSMTSSPTQEQLNAFNNLFGETTGYYNTIVLPVYQEAIQAHQDNQIMDVSGLEQSLQELINSISNS